MQNAYTRLEHAEHVAYRLIPHEILRFGVCKRSVTRIQEGCNVSSGDMALGVFALLQLNETMRRRFYVRDLCGPE